MQAIQHHVELAMVTLSFMDGSEPDNTYSKHGLGQVISPKAML
jgi:hypothetical protein